MPFVVRTELRDGRDGRSSVERGGEDWNTERKMGDRLESRTRQTSERPPGAAGQNKEQAERIHAAETLAGKLQLGSAKWEVGAWYPAWPAPTAKPEQHETRDDRGVYLQVERGTGFHGSHTAAGPASPSL